jgi:stage II sporulation protein D
MAPAETALGGPPVAIGLVVGSSAVALGGGAALVVTDGNGARIAEIPAGETWRALPSGRGVTVSSATGWTSAPAGTISVAPIEAGAGAWVRAQRRDYRGTVSVTTDRTGLTAINRLGLEEYLSGVVGAEMGRRDPREAEALRAQAIVSRSYALRNMGRWRVQGFDFYATVADQVYLGVANENPLARAAVAATRGRVLTYGGAPIDAFFFSTCGGRTAEGTEVFRNASRPYLRSVSDASPAGTAWCAPSPRFSWREEWTGEALRGVMRRNLPAAARVSEARVTGIRDVRVTGRTESGRVALLAVSLPDGDVTVDGPQVRQVLRNGAGDILKSTLFSLRAETSGGRVTRLVAEGNGNGHAVGFCQWGAVGRARAGQAHEDMLAAYYPGATLERYY